MIQHYFGFLYIIIDKPFHTIVLHFAKNLLFQIPCERPLRSISQFGSNDFTSYHLCEYRAGLKLFAALGEFFNTTPFTFHCRHNRQHKTVKFCNRSLMTNNNIIVTLLGILIYNRPLKGGRTSNFTV